MSGIVSLRVVQESDLPIFFEQQLDPDANYMAAFTRRDPQDEASFTAHWTRILHDTSVVNRTIVFDEQVAGYLANFEEFGEPEIGYWIGKSFWGKGIATRALAAFLDIVQVRPVYAYVAKDNVASLRVLQKCGFILSGEQAEFSNARGVEVEQFILRLDENGR